MQEDKLSKQIADSLKKYQESQSQPYDEGAWENFDRSRKAGNRQVFFRWASGVAATLLLLAAVYFIADTTERLQEDQLLTEEIGQTQSDTAKEESPSSQKSKGSPTEPSYQNDKGDEISLPFESQKSEANSKVFENTVAENLKSKSENGTNSLEEAPAIPSKKEDMGKAKNQTAVNSGKEENVNSNNTEKEEVLEVEKAIAQIEEKPVQEKTEVTSGELQTSLVPEKPKTEETTPLIAWKEESEIKEIPKEKSDWTFGVGLAPGYGASQQNGANVSSSSLGLGLSVDLELPGKITLGSGLGYNLLNQQNEASMVLNADYSNAFAANVAPPSTETVVVRQSQVEIPIYVKYPITRSQSIAIQAGFSNFYAFKQKAELKTTFSRQVTLNQISSSGYSTYTTMNENVVQSRSLDAVESKFYPFATMNFGLNLRLLQSEKTSYFLMPFYNYPLTQFTGFGDNPGFVGASFKVNFGGGNK
ncbi:outer membrane beta-barrel protein [Algoriphagus sp. PAP.12]|uniref:outer membrane beta-barrel protein n=1 Tax=Algoriphagus sp. PAP.12 TaxID=2996678 RepID=UPI00227B1386|nr:outer membrane beta-barrel protein [Algoriphagus sp. PAP.12]